MPELITAIRPGLYRIQMPIPVPLRYLNAYALKGPHGWTLVDCGLHDAHTEATWRQVADELGFGPGDVEAIFVTHLHLDHYGAAGWLQQWLGAPVLMGAREAELAERLWGLSQRAWEAGDTMVHAQGCLPKERQLLWDEWVEDSGRVQPQPKVTPVADEAELVLGGRHWQAFCLPGHSDGLLVLWNEAERLLLGNDMILATITPVISLWPGCDPDPLGSYLESLQKVTRFPADLVLTGHREPIRDLAGRVREVQAHHAERIAAARAAVAAAGPAGASARDVSQVLFGPQEDSYRIRFATGESASHLEYLTRRDGLVSWEDEAGVRRYGVPSHEYTRVFQGVI